MSDVARAKAAFDRALELLRAGEPAQAEIVCRTALEERAGDPNLLCLMGAAMRRQHRLPEAEAVLRRALARSPRYAKAHEELGTVLLLMGRASDARTALDAITTYSADVRAGRHVRGK